MRLTITENERSLDVIVKPEQRIQEVYRILVENGCFAPLAPAIQLKIYSRRQTRYVNPMLTFRQGNIYEGDILNIS
ncbi:MAG TPA: hypothetical protein H9776_11265 [Candidatus Mediterraneibacter intestinipullorum]|nr:hypothetical protein [Candidatus Mediterraneibacter intestinipullorum]